MGLNLLKIIKTEVEHNFSETEVVGLSDYMPFNFFIRLLMEAQGFTLKSNVVYQNNKSSIRMERNGRASFTGNSRHIRIRYLSVKNRQDKGKFSIYYCPT